MCITESAFLVSVKRWKSVRNMTRPTLERKTLHERRVTANAAD